MHFQASAWNSTSLVVASVRPSHCSLVPIITSQICKAFDCELSSCGVLSKPMFGQVFIVGVHLGGPQSAGTIEPLCKTLLCGSCLSSHSDIFHEKLVCIESERQVHLGTYFVEAAITGPLLLLCPRWYFMSCFPTSPCHTYSNEEINLTCPFHVITGDVVKWL